MKEWGLSLSTLNLTITMKPVYTEHGYNKLRLTRIPVKIPCILNFRYQTAFSVLWDIPNFPAPDNHVFTPSGNQLCSD